MIGRRPPVASGPRSLRLRPRFPRSLCLGALCLVALCLGVGSAAAQATSTARTEARVPDPMDPRVPVPALRHVPGFTGYMPYTEQAAGNWREANEATRRAGGWRAYAREIAPSAAPAARPHH